MRKVLAVVAACGLGIALASGVWAQDNKAANGDQNQEKDKARGETITVRGVIAEVNAEGELAIDYQTKQAVLVAATYLTIVETPKDGQGDASKRGDADRKDEGKDKDKNKDQAKDGDEDDDTSRRNVYIVWLSPRTKVYEASGDSEKAAQKKEAPPDRIDVGEVVEVQMTRRAETAAEPGVDQSGPARRKHGRYRVVLGDAKEITILSPATEDKPSSRK